MSAAVLVVGGLNIDVHLFGERTIETEPEYAAERHVFAVGGKGANAARAAAALGVATALVGVVGSDVFGRAAVDAVAGGGVDVSMVRTTASQATGFAAVRLREGSHRTLAFAPGANEELSPEEASVALDTHPDAWVVVQAEVPSAVLAVIAGSGRPFVLDPCPTRRVTAPALAAARIVTPNRVEAAELAGVGLDQFDPERAVAALTAGGAPRVALKLGPDGTLLAVGESTKRIPTIQVDARDETGAGDVYAAALAVRLSEDARLDDAVEFAGIAAALAVTREGVYFPSRQEVDAATATFKSSGPHADTP